jgi:hypothetical protein
LIIGGRGFFLKEEYFKENDDYDGYQKKHLVENRTPPPLPATLIQKIDQSL